MAGIVVGAMFFFGAGFIAVPAFATIYALAAINSTVEKHLSMQSSNVFLISDDFWRLPSFGH